MWNPAREQRTSRRQWLRATAALAALPAAAVACGRPAQQAPSAPKVSFNQPVSVAFWHTQTGPNAEAINAMIETFNRTNDRRITIAAEYQGDYTTLHQKNLVALSAGTPTDFSVAYENMIAEYQRGNAMVDLDEYVKNPELGLSKESLDDIFPAYLEGLRFSQYGNKLLQFPFTKSLNVMYVNEEVLQKANVRSIPKTWAEFAAAVQQASRSDTSWLISAEQGVADAARARTYGWGNYPSASTINAWAYSRGGTMLAQDNKQVRFLEPPYLEAFQLTEDTFRRGYAYNPPRQPGNDYDFVANRFAFIHMSSTSRPFIRRVMRQHGREGMAWQIAIIPQKDPAKPATVMFGANISIFRSTPIKQAAAWLFIKWFTDRDQNVQWSITSSYMPIRRSAAESPTLKGYWAKDDPHGKQAFDLVRYSKPEPNVRGTEDIRPVIQNALRDVMEGKVSSRAALEEATRQANELLRQAG